MCRFITNDQLVVISSPGLFCAEREQRDRIALSQTSICGLDAGELMNLIAPPFSCKWTSCMRRSNRWTFMIVIIICFARMHTVMWNPPLATVFVCFFDGGFLDLLTVHFRCLFLNNSNVKQQMKSHIFDLPTCWVLVLLFWGHGGSLVKVHTSHL